MIIRSLSPVVAALTGAAMFVAVPARAQAPGEGAVRTYELSAEQKAKLLETSTEASAEAARAEGLGGGGADQQIHGEVGAVIGTGGARGLFGTAAIPLGENAGAIVSFENSRIGDRRRR